MTLKKLRVLLGKVLGGEMLGSYKKQVGRQGKGLSQSDGLQEDCGRAARSREAVVRKHLAYGKGSCCIYVELFYFSVAKDCWRNLEMVPEQTLGMMCNPS